jgi:hypothetical protein
LGAEGGPNIAVWLDDAGRVNEALWRDPAYPDTDRLGCCTLGDEDSFLDRLRRLLRV